MTLAGVATVLGPAGPGRRRPAAAQGLGDAAASEREKRAKQAREEGAGDEGLHERRTSTRAGRPGQRPAQRRRAALGARPEATPARGGARAGGATGRAGAALPRRDPAAQAQAAVESHASRAGREAQPDEPAFIYGAGGSNGANEEARCARSCAQAEAQLAAARQAVVPRTRACRTSDGGAALRAGPD